VILNEEYGLRLFENRMLRRRFGPKGDDITDGCKKLHKEEHLYLHSSPSIIRKIRLR
jgi:hypothetical protein